MDRLPTYRQQDAKVVEPDVVGDEPSSLPLGCRRRVATILAFSLVLGGVGLVASILGAPVGIPLILLGLVMVVGAVIIGVGGGRLITFRRWRDDDYSSDFE